MKKIIKVADIKTMVEIFNLTEDEQFYLENFAYEVNSERTNLCAALEIVLVYGTSIKEKINAINALLVYVGSKVQKENDLRMKLDETTWKIATLLKCSSYYTTQWLKGIAYNNDRFGKYVECSDRFGLNYLEIEL